MPDVRIYLTDGFAGDHVIVSVDGRTVFDRDGVSTKKLYGLAEEIAPVTVSGTRARIEIKLPKKGLSATIDADLSKGTHVPVTLEQGRLTHSVQRQVGFM